MLAASCMSGIALRPHCLCSFARLIGSLNDFSRQIKWRLYEEPDADLIELSLGLSETPIMIPFGGDSPQELTRRLLA